MMLTRMLAACGLVLLAIGLPGQAFADVYKFVGKNGQVTLTDKPRHRGYRLLVKSPERPERAGQPPGIINISLGSGHRLDTPSMGYQGDRAMTNTSAMLMSDGSQKGRALHERRMQYANVIEAAANRHGLDPGLLHAVIQAESSYNPGAVSNKGAVGLMQLMPGTAARYGVRNPYNPEENIFGGARYLRDLMGMFRSDVRLAVAAYNAGEHNVMKYGYQVPPFHETRDYVTKVLGFYSRFN